ncbi:SDR family oxidoreductase [Halomonas sp. MCCC 1A17488]|uniref:SDR family oxidoreductase n=1 Tax=unclassified Halomonas TaxID=2609666 RepID=UPI0018D266EF|nr:MULTISPECIES: SDR family oxidoreductase [unclassified Halomonas]MCE8014770.1 SDR family oxidoreductase [Halomonas sp. MCCC 1A17488]MCG3238103.1 SDR family oxidoreductase [Halomonas sp. MCCC 1A17488]QPP48125.1 SDR family oxidoreductase [Halomonas sp. SS10-MC5]
MRTHDLHDTVVVLTGASSGIGRAAAHEFARRGAALFLVARDRQALHGVAEACHRLGGQARIVVADVSRPDDMSRVAREAYATAGRIDVWVNNAGVGALGAFEQVPREAHEQVIQTDLLGSLRGAHAVLPYFKRQGYGTLIDNVSLGGWAPQPYAASYSAAKFGLRAFGESLRGELRRWPNIHVCQVFPAVMDTPGFRDGANHTGRLVARVPPVYDPRRTARAIVGLAMRPRHSVYVGLPAVLAPVAQWLPGYSRINAGLVEAALRRARPVAESSGNLFAPPRGERRIDGRFRSPRLRRAVLVSAAAAAVAGAWLLSRQREARPVRR